MAAVLVIDDDDALRRVIGRLLTRAGHTMIDAADGQAGLSLFRTRAPDLVITDLIMPTQEGIETIRLLRKEAPHLPILAISGFASGSSGAEYLKMAKSLGADAMLGKPFTGDELIAAVARLLPLPGAPTLSAGEAC